MKKLFQRLLSRFGLYVSKGYTVYFFNNKKLVRRTVFGRELLMPRDHSITENLVHFPYYNSNLPRLVAQYQQFRKEKFAILDIGANIGDTLIMLRQVSDLPVHCFEGDPFYFQLLEQNSKGIANCYLHPVLLSDKPSTLKVRNNIHLGTSTFIGDAEDGTPMNFSSVDHFLAEHHPEEPVGLIKSDTDGFDLRILRGAAETLRKYRPIVFLEFDRTLFEKNGDDGLQFLEFMAGLNYDGLVVYDNFGKLLCLTSLKEKDTVKALLSYIRNQKLGAPFYDLAIFPAGDEAFFRSFGASELQFFEQ